MSTCTVIIPSFNQAQYIAKCIESVLAQTKKALEIIVVDDYSSDNTEKIVKPYLKKITFIRHKRNFGSYAYTYNTGIKHAKGDYLLIVSADDRLAPTILEKEAAILDKNPNIGLVYSQAYSVESSKNILRIHNVAGHKSYIGRSSDFELLLTQGDFISSINALVRRNVYKKLDSFDTKLRYMADYEMWIRIAQKYQLAYIAKPLTYYTVHGNNLHLNSDFAKITRREFEYILKKYLPSKKNNQKLIKTRQLAYYNFYLKLTADEIIANNSKTALQFWLKAIKLKPHTIFTYKALQPAYFAAKKLALKT